MSQAFVISDLHFGHKNVAALRGFDDVEQHDEWIIRSWNSVVGKNDLTIILGDIAMENDKHYHKLDLLNGRKKVVMGNHDSHKHVRKLLEHVDSVCGSMEYRRGVILTHIPVHPSQLNRFYLNIHGHLHKDIVGEKGYANVSVERLFGAPLPIKLIMEMRQDEINNN